MAVVTPAPVPKKFTDAQVKAFEKALAQGHPDDVCAAMAGIEQGDVTDLIGQKGMAWKAEHQIKSKLPLAKVRERMNEVMADAMEDGKKMSPELAMEILGKQDPGWNPTQRHDLTSKGQQMGVIYYPTKPDENPLGTDA